MTEIAARAPPPAQPRPAALLLFETSICDLHWSALHIGVVATLLGASQTVPPERSLRTWRHVLFQDSEAMLLALKYCEEDGLPLEHALAMAQLYRSVASAKAGIARLTTGRAGAPEMPRAEIDKAAATWRRLAIEAGALLKDLQDLTRKRLSGPFVEDSRTLIDFLAEAASGRTQRIGARGDLELPQLMQRRAAPRVKVSGPCRVIYDGVEFAAELQDASQRGLGLTCKAKIDAARQVTVELPDGRRLNARVVRRQGDRLGLQLGAPLSRGDPLLRV